MRGCEARIQLYCFFKGCQCLFATVRPHTDQTKGEVRIGITRIMDDSGRDMELAPIRDAVVLPESERYLFVRFAKPLPGDEFRIVSRLDVGLPELLEAETRVAAPPGR